MIREEVIPVFGIEDINPNDPNVNYLDSDMVFVDDMRLLPDADAMKVKINLTLICLRGKLSVMLNGQRVEVGERQVLVSRTNVIADSFMFSPNYEGKLLMVTDRLARFLLGQHIDIWQREFYSRSYVLITLDERDFAEYSHFYELLSMKIEDSGTVLHREVILALLQAALLDLCRKLRDEEAPLGERQLPTDDGQCPVDNVQGTSLHQGSLLFHRFLDLLTHETVKRRSVAYYAGRLCITPKYLATICQRESGKSPREWIREYTLVDIAYYLKSTTLTVKEIADRLEFPNLSFFGRYVREHMGVSPTQFRENLHKVK